jgi:hypothetical protein
MGVHLALQAVQLTQARRRITGTDGSGMVLYLALTSQYAL